jgi:hypothetical protein
MLLQSCLSVSWLDYISGKGSSPVPSTILVIRYQIEHYCDMSVKLARDPEDRSTHILQMHQRYRRAARRCLRRDIPRSRKRAEVSYYPSHPTGGRARRYLGNGLNVVASRLLKLREGRMKYFDKTMIEARDVRVVFAEKLNPHCCQAHLLKYLVLRSKHLTSRARRLP